MSMSKIEEVLASKGFVIRKYFTLDDYCIYLEVFSVKDASRFMLYVTGRYELKVPPGIRENVYPLKYMEIDNIDTAQYAEEPEKADMEEFYNHFNINFENKVDSETDLERKLKEDYNYEVTLKDLKRDDLKNLKDTFRQLKRFMLCVKNIKYKISMFYRNYLCSITKDDELDAFLIMNFPKVEEHSLYIYIDLKTLFEKMNSFATDIVSVKEGIHRLLDNNQMKHTKVLNDLISQRVTILSLSESIAQKKTEILGTLTELQKVLHQLNQSENETCSKLADANAKYSDFNLQGLHNDIERTHLTSKLQNDLKKITGLKKDVLEKIFSMKTKYENMSLKLDSSLFDNSIMIHSISKNFETLSGLVG